MSTQIAEREQGQTASTIGLFARSFLMRFSRILALLLLALLITTLNPNFLRPTNLINIVRQASPQIIVAVGMTVVLLTGGIDLSQGAVITLGSIVAGYFLTQTTLPWPVAFVAGLATGAVIGLVNAFMVAKVRLPPAIATYGMLWVGKGLAFAVMGASPFYGFCDPYRYMGRGVTLGIPAPIWIMVLIVIAVYLMLRYTTFGRNIYALGANPRAAQASGIRTMWVTVGVFVLSGVLAALAGQILCARLNAVDQDIGDPFLLPAIASPVMGGTSMAGGQGGVGGTVIGALIMVVLINGMNLLGISSLWQQFAIGLVVVLAVGFDLWMKRRQE